LQKCPEPAKNDLEMQERQDSMHGWSLLVSVLSMFHFFGGMVLIATSAYCIVRDVSHWD